MANDIDMWEDLESMDKRTNEYNLLFNCYNFMYIEYDERKAEECKKIFINRYGYWGNYF